MTNMSPSTEPYNHNGSHSIGVININVVDYTTHIYTPTYILFSFDMSTFLELLQVRPASISKLFRNAVAVLIRGQKGGQQDVSTAGGRWRRQHKTEMDGNKWSEACVPPAVTRHKSCPFCRLTNSMKPLKDEHLTMN